MKKLFRVAILALCLACCNSGFAQQLLIGGSGFPKVAIIEKKSRKIVWEHPLEKGWECNNVLALNNDKHILFTYKKGVKVVTLDHKEVWNIDAPNGTEMQSAKLLPNGNCLIAWCGKPLTIMEVKPENGEIISKTEYDSGIEKVHGQMRQVNKMDNGNYIVPIVTQNFIHIITPEGKLVKKIKVAGKPFCVAQIKGNRYMVAGGDAHNMCEVDLESGEIIRVIKDGDVKGSALFFVGGIVWNKKSFYMCNWQGHSKGKTGPELLEIDENLNVIWKVESDDPGINRISTVYPIKYKKKKEKK